MRKSRLAIAVLVVCLMFLAASSGRLLVVNEPRKSDVILVLAGETDRRPARALELLEQGFGRKLVLDVPAGARIYQWAQPELARRYVEGLPQAAAIVVCPIEGLSTKAEARDAARCLRALGGRDVLLVTSDFHTRRALSIFRRQIPDRSFSVAAVYDGRQFGAAWWRRRQWAKVNFDEWMRWLWWEVADRWL